jgi:heat shock protein HslJ
MSVDSSLQGSWTVTAYRSGDHMVFPDDRVEANLVIDGDVMAGTMGVNRFTGRIGDGLPLGALAMTRMAGPAELMTQEDLLLEHLQNADAVDVVDDGMFVRRDGLLLVELERRGTDIA